MKRVIGGILVVLLVAAGTAESGGLYGGLGIGMKGGFSYRGTFGISDFARGFPFGLELGVSYSGIDPGDPVKARHIFINDNTNGTPQKDGWTWDARMDFMYNLRLQNVKGLYLHAGPRLSHFTADFNYVDGNEDFEVTSTQWGIGVGAKGVFAVSPYLDFTIAAGLDGYFPGTLYGHGTTYTPDNLNVNAKEIENTNTKFTYSDAAKAVTAPKLQPVFLIGLAVNF
jgi:hypothetical protein